MHIQLISAYGSKRCQYTATIHFCPFSLLVTTATGEDPEQDNGGFDENFVQRQQDFADRSQSLNSEDARAAASALRQEGTQEEAAPPSRPTPPSDYDEDDEERKFEREITAPWK